MEFAWNVTVDVSRPDIQAAVSILCRFASNPSERHLKALRGILARLSGTKNKGVCFTKTPSADFKLTLTVTLPGLETKTLAYI